MTEEESEEWKSYTDMTPEELKEDIDVVFTNTLTVHLDLMGPALLLWYANMPHSRKAEILERAAKFVKKLDKLIEKEYERTEDYPALFVALVYVACGMDSGLKDDESWQTYKLTGAAMRQRILKENMNKMFQFDDGDDYTGYG